ncbi:MAG: hypothetical protein KY468_09605, partial [Armatimonadetes bacterium]|nr:hypothetical protein [Armatimonadota bacterium]
GGGCGNATTASLSIGAAGTFSALGALADKTGDRSLIDSTYQKFKGLYNAELGIREGVGGFTSASSQLTKVQATGAAPNSNAIAQVTGEVISSFQNLAKKANEAAENIKGDSPEARARRAEFRGMADESSSKAALLGFQQRTSAAQFTVTDLSINAGIATGELNRSLYGRSAGFVPSTFQKTGEALAKVQREAEANANRSDLDPNFRQQQRLVADQTRQARFDLNQKEFLIKTLEPSMVSGGFTARQRDWTNYHLSTGVGEGRAAGLLASDVAADRRLVGVEERTLQSLMGSPYSDPAMIEAQRGKLHLARRNLAMDERAQAYLPSDFEIRRTERTMGVMGARAGYQSMLGGGSEAFIGLATEEAGLMDRMAGSFRTRAGIARRRGEADAAEGFEAQAEVLGFSARSTRLSSRMRYAPEATESTRIGKLETAVALSERDPFTAGMVPVGVRRGLLSEYGNQIGKIDAQIAGTKDPREREAVEAALSPARNDLLLRMQEQRNQITYGDMGHAFELMGSTPSGGNAFGRQSRSLRMYQRLNPGGLRVYGGSGENAGGSDLMNMALSSPQGMFGGGGNAPWGLIIQHLASIDRKSGGTGGGKSLGFSGPTPDQVQRARGNGTLGY